VTASPPPEVKPQPPPTSAEAADPDRAALQRRVLLVVLVTVFLDMIGFGVVLPQLPFYINEMGGTPRTVGLLFTCFAAAQLLATPVLGRLSDQYGRRRIIVFSLAGNAISMIVFAVATELRLLPLLFVSRILAGATAGNLSACQAAIADVTDRNERAQGMGRIGAGIGLGLVFGPVLGGVVSALGNSAPPLMSALLALGALCLAIVLMPETRRPGAPGTARRRTAGALLAALADRRFAPLLALYFFTFIALSTMQVALALLVKERFNWGKTEIGYLFGLLGLSTVLIQGGLIGRLTRAFGEFNLMQSGAVLIACGMLLIGFSSERWHIIAGVASFGVGIGITNPSVSSLASRFAPPDQQGAMLGVAQSAGGLARAIGPSCAGFLYSALGSGAPFKGGAIAAGLSLLTGLYLRAVAADSITNG
jgi:MFS transporter, DHA1 family, tetracycline resistance protein